MSATSTRIDRLPHALRDGDELARRLAGTRPAVFLDYDGALTPIVGIHDLVVADPPGARHRARSPLKCLRS